MKKFALLSALALTSTYSFAQTNENTEPPKTSAKPATPQQTEAMKNAAQEFSNLPEETRKKFLEKRQEAGILFQNKRIFEALEVTRQLIETFPDDPQVINLRGACFVEIRDFDKATAEFKRSEAITGPTVNVTFNIAEVAFVSQQWQKSLDTFTKALEMAPQNAMQMKRLIEFKIMLCHIALSKDSSVSEADRKKHQETVAKMANLYDYRDNSPYYYYAKAAYHYSKDDNEQGNNSLNKGRRVYSGALANQIASWEDTMTEFGYVKSYYGNTPKESEEASE